MSSWIPFMSHEIMQYEMDARRERLRGQWRRRRRTVRVSDEAAPDGETRQGRVGGVPEQRSPERDVPVKASVVRRRVTRPAV